MSDRYIPGVPCWIDTAHPDPAAAAAFYGDLFGWELEDVMPPDAPGRYYMARLRGEQVAAIGSQMQGAPPTATWNSYIWVENADETAAKVRDAGGSVLMEPFDVMDAGRMAGCADRSGAVFFLWQPGRHRGATLVNEPGTLNFNNLSTADVDGSREFYGAVFGWDLLDLGPTGAMWALPAYGDFLEERTPGMRARMVEMGAPERFIEVVAGFQRTDDGSPAHWGVTFAVEDADAVAARASELGGRVVMPPFDAPWVRMTVIEDPQGATFTASKFVPENKDISVTGSAASA